MKEVLNRIKQFEKEESFNVNDVFSQIFKKQRIKRNMTLEKASEGICSISYLSKLENKQIENIEDEYMMKLCERVDLDYVEVKASRDSGNLEELALDYLSGNYSEIEARYLEICDNVESVRNDIVRAFYYLINKKYDLLKEVLLLIDQVKGSLRSIESYLYVILNIEFAININKTLSVESIYKELSLINCRFKYLNWLIYYQGLRIGYLQKNYVYFHFFYSKIIVIDDMRFPIDIIIMSRMMKIELELDSGLNLEISQDFINCILENKNHNKEYEYLKLLILFRKEMYLDITNYIKLNSLVLEPKYLGLYAISAYLLNSKDEMEFVKYNLEQAKFTNYDLSDRYFVEYIILKYYNSDCETLGEFISSKINVVHEQYRNRLYNDYIFNEYIEILDKKTKYKDTVKFLIKSIREKRIK